MSVLILIILNKSHHLISTLLDSMMNKGKNKKGTTMTRLSLLIPPPVVLVICAVMAYLISQYQILHWAMPLPTPVIQITLLLALTIALAAILPYIKHQTTVNPHKVDKTCYLIETGIYAYSRNPMYLSLLLMLCAYCGYLASPLSFIACFVFIAYLNKFQIGPEEAMLKKKFADQYQDYCARVRRWC